MATTLITSRCQPNVGLTLCLIETGWHYTLAFAGLVEPTIGNNAGPMSKLTLNQRHFSTLVQQNCQQNANVDPTNG